ncbi:MAG: LysE family transporter [Bacteroidales bacterium]|nr:LysE family transporter [Bacteroidales bacterium]
MFDLFWKGILIGIISSAPMGPVGILCIQRTLNKGRWHGFATGIGASFSDLFYAIITGLGMGFVLDFIKANLRNIQFVGSTVLLILGIFIFFKRPFHNYRKTNGVSPHLFKEFSTAFLFTISNALIIFLFIALFAHLQFITSSESMINYIAGFGGILLGSIAWWFGITLLFDRLRGRITLRQLWLVNRITGGIIILLSLAGIFSAFFEDNVSIAQNSLILLSLQ